VELFGSGIFFKQLIELLEVLWWVPDAVAVEDDSPKATDGVVNGNLSSTEGSCDLRVRNLR
jgi:hypothetical protein